MTSGKKVLTPLEVAKEMGLCRKTVYGMLKKGQLPFIKAGDKYLIPVSALERYLANAGQPQTIENVISSKVR